MKRTRLFHLPWEGDHWYPSWGDTMGHVWNGATHSLRSHCEARHAKGQESTLWKGTQGVFTPASSQVSPANSMGIRIIYGQENGGRTALWPLSKSHNAHIWGVLQYRNLFSPGFPRCLDSEPFWGTHINLLELVFSYALVHLSHFIDKKIEPQRGNLRSHNPLKAKLGQKPRLPGLLLIRLSPSPLFATFPLAQGWWYSVRITGEEEGEEDIPTGFRREGVKQ